MDRAESGRVIVVIGRGEHLLAVKAFLVSDDTSCKPRVGYAVLAGEGDVVILADKQVSAPERGAGIRVFRVALLDRDHIRNREGDAVNRQRFACFRQFFGGERTVRPNYKVACGQFLLVTRRNGERQREGEARKTVLRHRKRVRVNCRFAVLHNACNRKHPAFARHRVGHRQRGRGKPDQVAVIPQIADRACLQKQIRHCRGDQQIRSAEVGLFACNEFLAVRAGAVQNHRVTRDPVGATVGNRKGFKEAGDEAEFLVPARSVAHHQLNVVNGIGGVVQRRKQLFGNAVVGGGVEVEGVFAVGGLCVQERADGSAEQRGHQNQNRREERHQHQQELLSLAGFAEVRAPAAPQGGGEGVEPTVPRPRHGRKLRHVHAFATAHGFVPRLEYAFAQANLAGVVQNLHARRVDLQIEFSAVVDHAQTDGGGGLLAVVGYRNSAVVGFLVLLQLAEPDVVLVFYAQPVRGFVAADIDHLAVGQFDHRFAVVVHQIFLVRDEQNQMVAGDLAEQIHDKDGVRLVKVSRRLVGKDDARILDNSARNGNALLLTARE